MIEDYVEQYMSALIEYKSLDEIEQRLLVKYDPLYIDGRQLETKLINAIANHFKAKKADVKKLLDMEEI